MIRKVSKSQAERAKISGGRVKQSAPMNLPSVEAPPAKDLVADSIETAMNDLASMFSQHLTMFNQVTLDLREENRDLKQGQIDLRLELKALREREVELVPTRDRAGDIERILVKPVQTIKH